MATKTAIKKDINNKSNFININILIIPITPDIIPNPINKGQGEIVTI